MDNVVLFFKGSDKFVIVSRAMYDDVAKGKGLAFYGFEERDEADWPKQEPTSHRESDQQ